MSMSTYEGKSEGFARKRHDGYLPIGVAVMLICTLVAIFVINPQAGGYGGGNNPMTMWEAAGLIWGGVLVGYVALIFRST